MSKLIQFGENVEGYNIPVLNEREIRAAAGILFLATFISLMVLRLEYFVLQRLQSSGKYFLVTYLSFSTLIHRALCKV